MSKGKKDQRPTRIDLGHPPPRREEIIESGHIAPEQSVSPTPPPKPKDGGQSAKPKE